MTKAHLSHLKRIALIMFFGTLVLFVHAQQTPQFSQFMYNTLALNPAYAGAEKALSLTMLHRSQWTGIENAPSTQSFSAHSLIKKKQIGLGLTIIRDRIGVHKNTNILTNYAYHIYITENSILSMGIQAGITNLKSDYASLAGTSKDPKLVNVVSETKLDFGAGIYFRSPVFHLGLSSPGLLSQTVNLNDTVSVKLRRANLLGYSRYRFTLTEAWGIEPGVMVKYFTGLPVSVDFNLNLIYRNALTAGLSYRTHESIDLILKFQLTHQLQFGYAYDYPVQYAAKLSSASHELMLNYLFRNYHKNVESSR